VGSPCDVEDVDGTYAAWLESINARYLVIRPDFYVAASAWSADALQLQLDELLAQLYLTSAGQISPCAVIATSA
ncbi:bifunctional 3-(3-hydroxy-phenyl)propionate/3-hydroxycinnamic acid hydroxylase, partial [Pseudomonas neuropathica]